MNTRSADPDPNYGKLYRTTRLMPKKVSALFIVSLSTTELQKILAHIRTKCMCVSFYIERIRTGNLNRREYREDPLCSLWFKKYGCGSFRVNHKLRYANLQFKQVPLLDHLWPPRFHKWAACEKFVNYHLSFFVSKSLNETGIWLLPKARKANDN